jgi:transcriptional regulator with XRE-family HTH domain
MPKIIKVTPDLIEELFILYQEGKSLRDLAKHSGLSHTTIAKYFKKLYPNKYKRPLYGVTFILKEYLNSDTLTPKQKQELKQWIESNRSTIAASNEKNADINLYTENQLNNKSIAEVSSFADWREHLVDRSTDI